MFNIAKINKTEVKSHTPHYHWKIAVLQQCLQSAALFATYMAVFACCLCQLIVACLFVQTIFLVSKWNYCWMHGKSSHSATITVPWHCCCHCLLALLLPVDCCLYKISKLGAPKMLCSKSCCKATAIIPWYCHVTLLARIVSTGWLFFQNLFISWSTITSMWHNLLQHHCTCATKLSPCLHSWHWLISWGFLSQNCGCCFHPSLAMANFDVTIAVGCMATVVVNATTTATATASWHFPHNQVSPGHCLLLGVMIAAAATVICDAAAWCWGCFLVLLLLHHSFVLLLLGVAVAALSTATSLSPSPSLPVDCCISFILLLVGACNCCPCCWCCCQCHLHYCWLIAIYPSFCCSLVL